MSNRTKYILGGIGVGLFAWWILPHWLATLIVLAVIATPVVGYFMLDESQRRRIARLRERRQLRR
ncbi:hypothetical protein [Actinopolymorpha alba]|uniref:hypothetical protein n=1 Tax=Actinopolymorpha alba TaxID=533267 RepID=UPI00036510F1|nr:hypothetical protein [Actinopolymorpha alba]